MQLLIKQRVFSWLDSYNIYDEMQQKKYYVKSEVFTLGHRMHLYDLNGRELGRIKQELFTLTPRFEIEATNGIHGEIKKKFTFFKPRFELSFGNYTVEGDFFEWDYEVKQNDIVIASISKEFFHFTDTYVINVDESDALIVLMIVLAIDAIKDERDNNND